MHNGELMDAVATLGAPPAFAKFLKDGPYKASSLAHQRLRRGDGYAHVLDITTADAYRSGEPTARGAADLGGIRTALLMPFHKDSAILGHFGIYRQEVRPFSDTQIALLQNFAAQAVIAMENARLLGELRKQSSDLGVSLEYQTVTSEVLKVISRPNADLDTVMHTVLKAATSLCEGGR